MGKRKFQNEEDEEAQDQDYQDDQSPETDRVLRSAAPLTAPRPPLQYREEDEEDLGVDGSDATFEDNTNAVDVSKVRPQFSILVSMCLLNYLTLPIPTSLTSSVGVKA